MTAVEAKIVHTSQNQITTVTAELSGVTKQVRSIAGVPFVPDRADLITVSGTETEESISLRVSGPRVVSGKERQGWRASFTYGHLNDAPVWLLGALDKMLGQTTSLAG